MFEEIRKMCFPKELVKLIKTHHMTGIWTNGQVVFAWDRDKYDHSQALKNGYFEGYNLNDGIFTPYTIQYDGRLMHSVCINYPVLQEFLYNWFPDCYYTKHLQEFDPHDGLDVFLTVHPDTRELMSGFERRIIASAQPQDDFGEFKVFTEDHELPFRKPHIHICVDVNNKKYNGEPLRDIYWAAKYKSIFSIELLNAKENKNPCYTLDNLIIRDEADIGNFAKLTREDKELLLEKLNKKSSGYWYDYLTNNEDF